MFRNRFMTITLGLTLASNCVVRAQSNHEGTIPNENGAVTLYFSGGTSFGLPANQASVVTSQGSIASPMKTALPNAGVGSTIRAWRFISPYVDFTAIDAGNASAQLGPFKSQIQDKNTFLLNGGMRLIRSRSRIRPYVQFGGGMFHTSATGTLTAGSQSTPFSLSGSAASAMYGGGLQLFYGRKWGSEIGFDGFHINKQLTTGGQNFSRFYVTLFFQTKKAIE